MQVASLSTIATTIVRAATSSSSIWRESALSHHVFIERARDPGAEASARLAAAIASRYGLPEAAIAQRLAAGRFRVKSNVDLPTARAFASDLERLGAVCAVVDAATGQTVGEAPAQPTAATSVASPPPVGLAAAGTVTPGSRPPTDQSPLAGAAPSTRAQVDQSPLAGAAPSTRAQVDQSPLAGAVPKTAASAEDSTGLAVAFSDPGQSQQELGALSGDALSVSSLDGAVEAPPPAADAAAFAPDDAAFAPPESEREELKLAVDIRRPEPEDELLTLVPEGEDPAEHAMPAPSPVAPREAAPPADDAVTRARRALADNDRVRLVAGVLLVLLLGFLPAHLLASAREDSAYGEVQNEVRQAYAEVRTVADWDGLDEYLAGQRGVMDDQRRNIAVTSLLVWALVAGGLGFVWFRVIDWDRVAPRA